MTDHVHEWWADPGTTKEGIEYSAYCTAKGCDALLSWDEVEAMLNNHAVLLYALESAKPWVAKCSADHDADYLGLRAHKVLARIEDAIRKAKEA